MARVGLAFRVFFGILLDRALAERIEALDRNQTAAPTSADVAANKQKEVPPHETKSKCNDALTLLAALQRESRIVDFVQEPIGDYTDAQIGAAVRDVHRDCAAVLERIFALRPLVPESEGAQIELPSGYEAAHFRLVGHVGGQPPYRGRLGHHGWVATKCELPQWTGDEQTARVVAPAEVELK